MSTPSIVVRAALTDDEWHAVQVIAVKNRMRPSELIAKVIRETLLNEKGESNGKA